MASIGEQIIAARKAKGMTQDALSREMNMSRQAVSHWETGRTLPDAQTLLKLSQVLDYSFAGEEAQVPGAGYAAPETDAVPTPGNGKTSATPDDGKTSAPRVKRRWIIICAAVLVAALAFGLWRVTAARNNATEPVDEPATAQEVPPEEYFLEAVENVPGKAYIEFQSSTSVLENDGQPLRMYTFELVERNGVGFSVRQVLVCAYSDSGRPYAQTLTEETLAATGFEKELEPYGSAPFNGGFPIDSFDCVGIEVRGVDANGEALAFRGYMDFRQ